MISRHGKWSLFDFNGPKAIAFQVSLRPIIGKDHLGSSLHPEVSVSVAGLGEVLADKDCYFMWMPHDKPPGEDPSGALFIELGDPRKRYHQNKFQKKRLLRSNYVSRGAMDSIARKIDLLRPTGNVHEAAVWFIHDDIERTFVAVKRETGTEFWIPRNMKK